LKRAIIFLYSLIVTSQVFSQITEEEKRFVKENNVSVGEYNMYLKAKERLKSKTLVDPNQAVICVSSTPANIDFELGNLSGWQIYAATNINLNPDVLSATTSPTLATIITSGTDQYTGVNLISPLGGNKIVKLNDNYNDASMQVLQTSFYVTNATKFLKTAFAPVFQTAAHNCNLNPYFKIEIYNCNETQKLDEYFTLIQEGYCVGDKLLASSTNSMIGNLSSSPWRVHCFDFSNYLNTALTIKITVADCPLFGHFGYAYFDAAFIAANTGLNYNYSINNTNLNFGANSTTTTCFQNAINLNLPNGASSYSCSSVGYANASGNFSATSQSFSVPPISTEFFYINMHNGANNCYQQQFINVGITPTISLASSSNTVCPDSYFTLAFNGANGYVFSPPPINAISTNSFVFNIPSALTFSVVGVNTQNCNTATTIAIGVFPTVQLTVTPVSQTICAANSATLNASGAVTYTWTGNSNGSVITVTPATTNNYTVSGTDINGCKANSATGSTITVLPINTNFSASAIGNSTICPGDSVFITCSNTAQSVLWSNGSTLTAQYVKPVTTTVYSVTGTMNCNTVVKTITVTVKSVLPTNITVSSPNVVCENMSFTVNATGAPTYTYIGTYSVVASGIASISLPVSANHFTVVAKNPANCSTTFSLIPVSVNPAPTLTVSQSASTLCAGQQVTVSATGANTYTWMQYSNALGTGSSISFTTNPFFTPVYYLYGTSVNGCVALKSFTVNTEPFPMTISASVSTLCLGPNYSATLTAAYANTATTTYTWNGNIAGEQIVVTPTTTTTYTLEANSSVCGYMTTIKTITVFPSYGPTSVNASISSNVACIGQQSISITATGANSYFYQNFAFTTNTVITVTPTMPVPGNTFVVEGYDTYGCKTLSNVLSLTVLPIPVLSSMASQFICPGTPLTLTVSGAQTYSWSTGSTNSLIVVSPTVATTYTVVGFSNPGSCSITAQKTVYVYPIPTLAVLPALSTSVCPGQSIAIYLSANSALTYSWSNGMTNPAISVSPTITTVYTVTIGDSNNCKASQAFTVGVYNLPVVSVVFSPSIICFSGTSVSSPVGSPPGGFFTPANYTTNILNPAGTYTVKYSYTDPATSCSNSAIGSYSVFPYPCVNATPVNDTLCLGQNTAFNLSPNGGILSGQFLNGNTFNPTIAGAYPFSYSYTDVNGCSAQACTSVFVDICTSVSKTHLEEDFELSIAPNPFNSSFRILTSQNGSFSYYIYDVNGKLIISSEAENNTEVSLSDFADGIYFLRFNQKASSKGIKVVKTR
jgi:hypothetical protein